jgi:origin recognition complex subunit 5
MGLPQLPDELVLTISETWPCRDLQLRQLAALLPARSRTNSFLAPSTIVVYGPHATGKTGLTGIYLEQSKLRHAIIDSRECVTGRHLLERIVAAVNVTMRQGGDDVVPSNILGRCENISALVAHLQRLPLSSEKLVLVLDGIDKQREAPPTLLPALARLGEFVPGLTTLLIVQHPSPRLLHATGIPHIHFPPYTRNQAIQILTKDPQDIFLEPPPDDMDYDDEVHAEDKAWLWPRYCASVWDSLAQNAARDLVSFRDVCTKLWRPFVAPIIKGDFGTRDFSRLMVAQRRLFQDEGVLLDSIVPASAPTAKQKHSHELPYYAKWLFIAAYLASFNPARMDALYFMKSTERRRRKKGGATAKTPNRPGQVRKIPRHLLGASSFTIDRLLAILHAILPHDMRSTIDVYTQIATLTSLRMLVRGGGIGASDTLEPGGKWRTGTAVTWEYAQALARSVDFDLLDYVAE